MRQLKFSVGIDIEEVSRLRFSAKNSRFLGRVFTRDEISYYRSEGKGAQSLAGMYAAKEATIKALSQLESLEYSLNDIEIGHEKGIPFVKKLRHGGAAIAKHFEFSLSIAHTRNEAVAVVVVRRK